MAQSTITLHISYRGSSHDVCLSDTSSLAELNDMLASITSVPPPLQKLLYKGKPRGTPAPQTSLSDVGLKSGMKVQLLGTPSEELDDMQRVESSNRAREDIMRARALKGPPKVRRTGTAKINNFIFHNISPLAHLPSPHLAKAVLNKLAADPAILHIMSLHKFSIGLLTELAPHEHPNLLGLNQNKGEIIKLRVRTDAYDGIRSYPEIRRVLCHELTHCVWGDHDDNFKQLNSLLNRQVAEYEVSVKAGAHSLSSYSGSTYEPELEAALVSSHTLGGRGNIPLNDSPESRRRLALDAALRRLAEEEKEIEDKCGNTQATDIS